MGLNTGVSSLVGVGVAPFAVGAHGSANVGVGSASALDALRADPAVDVGGGGAGKGKWEGRRRRRGTTLM